MSKNNYNKNNLSLPELNGTVGCLEKDIRKHDMRCKTILLN